tara:strand:- start:3731 stop:4360 length:630 start_codon:yes stop_codon:yes gene_type:complete
MSKRRGSGYWLWKPYLVNEALQTAEDGDIIIYTDAAVHFVRDPQPLLELADLRSIVLFGHGARLSEYTKRDTFVLLESDESVFWNTRMLTATFQVYKANEQSRNFVKEWLEMCSDARILTDLENQCGLPNFPDFKAHRHDQSVLSILAKKHGIEPFPDPSQFGNSARSELDPFPQIFDHHRRRTDFVADLRSSLQIRTRLKKLLRRAEL